MSEVVESTTVHSETTTEVVETKTITTKTSEDGAVVTEVVVTKTVTEGGDGDANQSDISTTIIKEVKENGGTASEPAAEEKAEETPVVEAAPENTEEAEKVEAVEEEKKEAAPETPPKVLLHQFPPGKSVPSYSHFCLKLETLLRMHKVPYSNIYSYKMSKKGQMPWIEYKGDKVADSSFAWDYLIKTLELDVDGHLSVEQKAASRALQVMLEENTSWTIAYHRWISDYGEWKKLMQPNSGGGIAFTVGMKMNQRKMRGLLEGHGIGRHSKEEIFSIAEKDLAALADYLDGERFLMGDQPSSIDAVAFGILTNILYVGITSPQSEYIRNKQPKLVNYCDRLKEEFWNDWDEMVQGDKPEPNLPKRLSFRRSKKKSKDKKEAEDATTPTEEDKPAEGKATEESAEKTEEKQETTENDETKESEAKSEETKTEEAAPAGDEKVEESTTPQVNGDATEEEKAQAEAE